MQLVMALAVGAAGILAFLVAPIALVFRHLLSWLKTLLKAVWSSQQCKQQQQHIGNGVKTHSLKRKLTIKDIPGPSPALPILGTRWVYSSLFGRYSINKVHEAYRDMFERHGGIVKEESLWNYPIISLREAEDIEKVMKLQSKYPMRPPVNVTVHYRQSRPDRYSSLGFVNEQGEKWYHLRSLLASEITSTWTVNSFLPELNNVADELITLIAEQRDQDTGYMIDFISLAKRMGLESSCMLMLGQRLGFLEHDLNPVASRLADAVRDHFNACRDSFFGLPLWKIFPTKAYRQLAQAEEEMYEIISDFVQPAIEHSDDTCPVDVVQSVLMSMLRKPELDMKEKKAGIIDFIAAGIGTLGNSLSILLYWLAINSKTQQRLYEELSNITQPGEPITVKTLQSATYLKACVQECYRILPTATTIARVTDCDLELSGYHVPAGTVVLCHNWVANTDERNFVHADKFIPERWLPSEAAERGLTPTAPFLVAPFGFTRRMCPGKKFAEQQLHLVLAKIIQRFEVHCEAEKLNLEFEFLLAPSGTLPFTFRDR